MASLCDVEDFSLPAAADMHVHLRQGAMSELVIPSIRAGGVDVVYVMPNLVPPLISVQSVLDYKAHLQALAPAVTFLMTLYLHDSTIPETIVEAKKAGITGVKSYPAGVTTNSSSGVVDYETFYPVFAEMERQDMVLNLHGECPSGGQITVLNAEEEFLPKLTELSTRFPKLRIVLEHCTTEASIAAVERCGPNVCGTITAHHLFMIVDDWAGDPFCFCKPVAKTPRDRVALLKAIVENDGKFFFGSDSAPHPTTSKRGSDKIAAGVFTQPYVTPLVVDAMLKACEEGVVNARDVTKECLTNFLTVFGRQFYGLDTEASGSVRLRKGDQVIPSFLKNTQERIQVVPFRRGRKTWSVEWVS